MIVIFLFLPATTEIVMITATQQKNIPTWKEVIGDGLLVEFEFKFEVNFSQRKHIFVLYAYFLRSTSVRVVMIKKNISSEILLYDDPLALASCFRCRRGHITLVLRHFRLLRCRFRSKIF